MSNNEAKLHLSLQDGIFEISGSELFVSQQIENFKDIILDALTNQKNNSYRVQTPPINETAAPVDCNKNSVHINADETISFDRVLHIEDKKVSIIKNMPGSNNSQKSINTALVYIWGMHSIGIKDIPLKDVRELCKQQGCLDPTNFASYIKGANEHILLEGKHGSSSKTCKLTMPGREKAKELLEQLNGE